MPHPTNSGSGSVVIAVCSRDRGASDGEVWHFVPDYDPARVGNGGRFTDLVQAAGNRVARDYIQLDRCLAPRDREEWDASDLGERSHYNCSLLLESVRAVALLTAVRAGGKHVAEFDDPLYAAAVYQIGRAMGLSVWWRREGHTLGVSERARLMVRRLVRTASAMRAFGAGLRATLRHIRMLRTLRRAFPIPVDGLRRAKVAIALWTDARTFEVADQAPRTSTFGPLPQHLLDRGVEPAYIAMPLSWIGDFSDIARKTLASHQPVLLLEDCWTPVQVLGTALASLFRGPRLSRRWVVDGIDLSPLVARSEARNRYSWRRVHARLCAAVGAKLAELGAAPRAVMAPFENQSWEKQLRAGVKKHLRSTEYLGCQLSLFDVDYHSFYLTLDDVSLGRIPDRLLTMGKYFSDLFIDHGYPSERTMEIGAVRYPQRDEAVVMRQPRMPLSILCGASVELDESVELAQIAAAALVHLPEARMVVNFHPVTDAVFRNTLKDSLARCHGEVFDRIQFSTEPASRLLETVDVVLYNTSGVAFDAMARGVPPIYVRRELGLDHDKMLASVSLRVRGADDLASTLSDLASGRRRFDDQAVDMALRQSMATIRLDGLVDLLTTRG